jgi:hypothetical protein
MIADHFGVDYWALHLVAPIFYTLMTTEGSRRTELSLPIVHQVSQAPSLPHIITDHDFTSIRVNLAEL